MSVASDAPLSSQVQRSVKGSAGSLALRAGATFALSAAAAVAVATLLVAGPGAGRGTLAPRFTEVGAVPRAEAAAFAILRRPLRSTDAFAPVHPGTGPVGANPALARTLREPRSGLSAGMVSVVPADGWVCLRVPFAQGGAQWWCQSLALAREGRLLMALRPSGPLRVGEQLLAGLVPDGVRTVSVTAAGGVRRSLPVRANVYDAQVYAPRGVSIDLPGLGVRRYPAP